MQKYYHGTVNTFVPSILANGLEVKPEYRFDALLATQFFPVNPALMEEGEHKIFLSSTKELAVLFAKAKADYFKAKRGQITNFGYGPQQMKKVSSQRIPRAEPALIEVELPSAFPLHADEHGSETETGEALYTTRPIPPQYLKAVEL